MRSGGHGGCRRQAALRANAGRACGCKADRGPWRGCRGHEEVIRQSTGHEPARSGLRTIGSHRNREGERTMPTTESRDRAREDAMWRVTFQFALALLVIAPAIPADAADEAAPVIANPDLLRPRAPATRLETLT